MADSYLVLSTRLVDPQSVQAFRLETGSQAQSFQVHQLTLLQKLLGNHRLGRKLHTHSTRTWKSNLEGTAFLKLVRDMSSSETVVSSS